MKTIGIFEAKTHFSQLCDAVAADGDPVLVQRRGRPVVLITAAPAEPDPEREGIHIAWKRWRKRESESNGVPEFPEVWKMRKDKKSHPL